LGKAIGKDAQGDGLADAGGAGDEGKAAFTGKLLDPPAERFDALGGVERLDRHVGGEGIPFEAVERQQLLAH
jgi:hypothetical protein